MTVFKRKAKVDDVSDPELASAVNAVHRLETLTDRLEHTTGLLEDLVRSLKEDEVSIEEVGRDRRDTGASASTD